MRLKTTVIDVFKHAESATALAWSSNDEVYSCGDDHVLVKWNLLANDFSVVTTLPEHLFPSSISFYPKGQAAKKQHSEVLLAASADGKFHFLNKNGRIEKTVEAHQGAILVALWSYDGAGLLTAGEDGQVKVWSKSGMLRFTVVSGDVPVYTAAWSSDSNNVLVAQGQTLLHKPLAPSGKPSRWKAHDGLILKVSWNRSNNLIVSAGEDCRYKVWDPLGHLLYSSAPHECPVSSVAWSPSGDVFAVAYYNTIRLCDRVGWCHSLHKVASGTIYDLAWSPDGTQLAGACSSGALISAFVVERRLEWKHLEVTLTSRDIVTVQSVLDDTMEKLDFAERVALMAIGFDHLLITTPSQCHIYSITHWNTPIIVQLKDGAANAILMTHRIFMMMERSGLNVYSYDGKLQSAPKLTNLQPETLDMNLVALSPDTVAIVDQGDDKIVHLLDLSTGRQATALQPLRHSQGIIRVALSQTGVASERRMAFLDSNRDAYLCTARTKASRNLSKLDTMVQALMWCSDAPLLAGVRDGVLCLWCCPAAVNVDKHILRRTTLNKDLTDLGKSLSLISFAGNLVTLRRQDGSIVSLAVPPYITILLDFIASGKWDDCLRLCRFIKDDLLWACLACLACVEKNLETVEEAYAAINEHDKVNYIQFIKSLPLMSARNAHLALVAGNSTEAESIFLMNGMIFRAIMLLIDTHQWSRALELAIKHKTHIDTVLYKRKLYLESIERSETNDKFLQFMKEVNVDIPAIEEKIANEYAKELGNM